VENILASATVGSLNPRIIPGKFALPAQFLDFTHGRAATFFDQEVVKHVDVTEPYCPSLRPALIELAREGNIVLHPGATYVCTQGPRFETPAEIEMFRRLGGDLAGMTGVPEVVLAREANICYATVALVTNWAAGMAGKSISHVECSEFGKEHIPIMRELFLKLIAIYPKNDCTCRHAIE
jgi:5'-methylthioadenosine phosphorylase